MQAIEFQLKCPRRETANGSVHRPESTRRYNLCVPYVPCGVRCVHRRITVRILELIRALSLFPQQSARG